MDSHVPTSGPKKSIFFVFQPSEYFKLTYVISDTGML